MYWHRPAGHMLEQGGLTMKKKANMTVRHILTGGLCAVGAAVLLCGLVGAMVQSETLTIQFGRLAAPVLAGLGLLLSCFLTARSVPQKRLPVSFAVAAVFTAVCLLIKIAAFGERTLSVGWSMAIPWISALLAGLLAGMKKQRRR